MRAVNKIGDKIMTGYEDLIKSVAVQIIRQKAKSLKKKVWITSALTTPEDALWTRWQAV